MVNLIHADIFFFVSTIGFIVIGILLAVLIFKIIQIVNTFSRILTKVESSINTIGDATKEVIEEMRDSFIFKLLFKSRKKRTKKVNN